MDSLAWCVEITPGCPILIGGRRGPKDTYLFYFFNFTQFSGADPGFPVGGGANPGGGAITYNFVKLKKKRIKLRKF